MGTHRVAGIFGSVDTAQQAREVLEKAGVAARSVTLSRSLAEDPIAAEAPGQSYENQPGQRRAMTPSRRQDDYNRWHGEAVRRGACVLTVEVPEDREAQIRQLMLEAGARDILRTPAP